MPDSLNNFGTAQLVARMQTHISSPAIDGDFGALTYGDLLAASERWMTRLLANDIGAGTVCGYIGDYSPETISLFLALMRLGAIAAPLTQDVERDLPRLTAIAGIERLVRFNQGVGEISDSLGLPPNSEIENFRKLGHPGLVVFTSGSTGQPKGILHDLDRVLGKFARQRHGWRAVLLLMMDHFGGVNTLLSVMANGGVAICVEKRSPDDVCRAIERTGADLLPTTPTFLNLILASGAWQRHNLSSVRLITYGTEPMSQLTLRRTLETFPQAELKQTYGLSEVGVLHSQSPDSKSLWLRIGGRGFETRVVDGVLHIRSESSMFGYLNAPSPIDEDGWMNTGDMVEEADGLIRFLGRKSEVINVGGQKVYPAEVESILLDADNVVDASVFGVGHLLLGQAVRARISLATPEPYNEVSERLRAYCLARLAKFKVPMFFEIVDLRAQITNRMKKWRPSPEINGF
jgi:long-chain acyl-CoA synthetase